MNKNNKNKYHIRSYGTVEYPSWIYISEYISDDSLHDILIYSPQAKKWYAYDYQIPLNRIVSCRVSKTVNISDKWIVIKLISADKSLLDKYKHE